MRVYVAGPMRGYDHFNFPAFHAAAASLRACGHKPVSPASIDIAFGFDPESDPVTPELVRQCIRRDVEAITSVDALVCLDGWVASVGATAERAIAQWAGIPVYDSLAEFFYCGGECDA